MDQEYQTPEVSTDPMDLWDLLTTIANIITGTYEAITKTTAYLDSFKFNDDFMIAQFFGYGKYVLGSNLYQIMCIIMLIGIGTTIFAWLFKGISYIKEVFPWK